MLVYAYDSGLGWRYMDILEEIRLWKNNDSLSCERGYELRKEEEC